MRPSPAPRLPPGHTKASLRLLDTFSGYNDSGGLGADDPFTYNDSGGLGVADPFTYDDTGGLGVADPYPYNNSGGNGCGITRRYTYNQSGGLGAANPLIRTVSGGLGASQPRSAFGWHGGRGTGYRTDLPDHRDYELDTIRKLVSKAGHQKLKDRLPHFCGGVRPLTDGKRGAHGKPMLPEKNVGDLSLALWPVTDQGPVHSCTAHAVLGLLEFLLRKRAGDKALHRAYLSRLFLYVRTRQSLGLSGDVGASLRATVRAVRECGAPPAEVWPDLLQRVELDPGPRAVQYSIDLARTFSKLDYLRLDSYGATGKETLNSIRRVLADGYPVVGGFPVYRSIGLMNIPKKGKKPSRDDYVIPPADLYPYDTPIGGHAVLIVGYEDRVMIKHPFAPGKTERGALIIRNSWGRKWADQGFGYLPYCYVTSGLACDFWTIISQNKFEEEPLQVR